jgi:hypothetical protein
LTAKQTDSDIHEKLRFCMDLLSHDIQNNNQAILSYLELIMSTPGTDSRTRRYAEKAASQLRTGAVLLENVRKTVDAIKASGRTMFSVDAISALAEAEAKLITLFPDRQISVNTVKFTEDPIVLGSEITRDLLLNVLVNVVQLDSGEKVSVTIRLENAERLGQSYLRIRIEDRAMMLPPILKGDLSETASTLDPSKTVKLAGLMFASLMTETLGGRFEADEAVKGDSSAGSAIQIYLRRLARK